MRFHLLVGFLLVSSVNSDCTKSLTEVEIGQLWQDIATSRIDCEQHLHGETPCMPYFQQLKPLMTAIVDLNDRTTCQNDESNDKILGTVNGFPATEDLELSVHDGLWTLEGTNVKSISDTLTTYTSLLGSSMVTDRNRVVELVSAEQSDASARIPNVHSTIQQELTTTQFDVRALVQQWTNKVSSKINEGNSDVNSGTNDNTDDQIALLDHLSGSTSQLIDGSAEILLESFAELFEIAETNLDDYIDLEENTVIPEQRTVVTEQDLVSFDGSAVVADPEGFLISMRELVADTILVNTEMYGPKYLLANRFFETAEDYLVKNQLPEAYQYYQAAYQYAALVH